MKRPFFAAAVVLVAACTSKTDDPPPNPDRRVELVEASEPLPTVGRSVALVVQVSRLGAAQSGRQSLDTKPLKERLALCDGERYADQPSSVAGFATAFLVAPDVVATAAHVLDPVSITDIAFAFGYALDSAGGAEPTSVAADDVVKAKSAKRAPDNADWALVTLEHAVSGRAPLALRKSGDVPVGTKIAVVGHPLTLPMKVAPGEVRVLQDGFVFVDTDTFEGNSGSPMVDAATGEVQGLFIGGGEDFTTTAEGCMTAIHRAPNDLTERAIPAPVIAAAVGP